MQSLLFDLRHILRSLLNHPIFSFATVLMLGLGLGLVLFMFGVIQSMVFQQPPYVDAGRIAHVELEHTKTSEQNIKVGVHTYLDIAKSQTSLSHLAAYYVGTINLGYHEAVKREEGVFVTTDIFKVLGEAPAIGRDFNRADLEVGAAPVAIIGYELWSAHFNSDPNIEGRKIRVNGRSATVIGVMKQGLRFPLRHDIWVPMDLNIQGKLRNSGNGVDVIGRLRPGVSLSQAQQEIQTLHQSLNETHPDYIQGDTVVLKPLAEEMVSEVYKRVFYIMMVAVVLVLLVACSNVAGLLGARAATRQRERTIRSVLGATRGRLLWEGLLEAGIITSVAGILGLALAKLGGDWFMQNLASSPNPPPSWALNFRIEPAIIGMTFAAVIVTTIIAGLYPALRAARDSVTQVMREGGNGSIGSGIGRMGRYLITIEIALSLVLLVSAGLVVRTLWNIQKIEVGADINNVLTGRLALLGDNYVQDPDYSRRFLKLLQKDLNSSPISTATLGSTLPMTNARKMQVRPADWVGTNQDELPNAIHLVVADNYFSFFHIQKISGRVFDTRDAKESQPVVVISQSLMKSLWPGGEDPLNRQLQVQNAQGVTETRTIVGVVSEVEYDGEDLHFGTGGKVSGAYYLPLAQSNERFWSIAMRSTAAPASVAGLMRDVVARHDHDLVVYWQYTMDEWVRRAASRHRLLAWLFLSFGSIALALTAAGLYALLAFTVAQRTREIGVHRALGAPARKIIGMIVHDGLKQLILGAVIGLVLARFFAGQLFYILFNVLPFDPISFIGAVLFFVVVCLTASLVPAIRAIRVTPMQALRYE